MPNDPNYQNTTYKDAQPLVTITLDPEWRRKLIEADDIRPIHNKVNRVIKQKAKQLINEIKLEAARINKENIQIGELYCDRDSRGHWRPPYKVVGFEQGRTFVVLEAVPELAFWRKEMGNGSYRYWNASKNFKPRTKVRIDNLVTNWEPAGPRIARYMPD